MHYTENNSYPTGTRKLLQKIDVWLYAGEKHESIHGVIEANQCLHTCLTLIVPGFLHKSSRGKALRCLVGTTPPFFNPINMHLGKARSFAVMCAEPDPVVPVAFARLELGAVVKAVVGVKGGHGFLSLSHSIPHICIFRSFALSIASSISVIASSCWSFRVSSFRVLICFCIIVSPMVHPLYSIVRLRN